MSRPTGAASLEPRQRGRIARRLLAGLAAGAAGALALAVATAHLLPGWLLEQVQARGSAALGREVRAAALEIDWLSLRLRLRELRVAGPSAPAASAEPALQAARVEVGLSLRSLTARAPVLDAVEVDAPVLRVARTGPQAFDFDDIVQRLRPAAPASAEPVPSGPPRLELRNLRVTGGALHLADAVTGQRHAVTGLALTLPLLSSLEGAASPAAEAAVQLQLDGAPVSLQASLRPFSPQREGQATLAATGLALGPWWAYLPAGLPVQPRDGRLDLNLKAGFASATEPGGRLDIAGEAALADFSLADGGGRPMLSFSRLALQGVEVSVPARRARLGLVRLERPLLEARREKGAGVAAAAPARPAARAAPAAPNATTATPAAAGASSASGGAGASPAEPAWQVAVDRTEIADGALRWLDALARPASTLEALDLQASALRLAWPLSEPAPVELSARLQSAGQPLAQLQARGSVAQEAARVELDLQGLRLEGLAPWLREHLRPALSGRVHAVGSLEWAAGAQPRLAARLQRLRAEALRLADAAQPRQADPLLSVAALELEGVQADLLARRVQLARVSLSRPQLRLVRDAAGRIDASDWVPQPPPGAPQAAPAAPRAAPAPAAAPAPTWSVTLGAGAVREASLVWRDLATSAAARPAGPRSALLARALGTGVRIDVPSLEVQDLAWPPGRRPARTALSVSIPRLADGTPPGTLQWRGTVGLEPPAARGTLQAARLPLHALEPYFGADLPMELAHAELGVQAELDLQVASAGWQGRASGSLLVADVRAYSRVADSQVSVGDELLSWQSLRIEPVRLERAAGGRPRLDIGQVVMSDLTTRLVITEQGRLNLVESAAVPGATPAAPGASAPAAGGSGVPPATPAAPAVAAAPASAASAAPPARGLPLDLSVGETRLVRGQIDFSDRFIQPNYSTTLSALEGRLGAFSTGSRQLPVLELRGRAAGTADLEIRGTVDPTTTPVVLDISARARGLELATLSPYAAKYAGYAIERGKLSVDVDYRIAPDGQLQARNQVIVNQLTFGDKVNSPSATKLPVRLAVALLADRNGVIDIDLPVSGSINDPQFSVFGLVMKVLGNLIVKAVTAPFAWLSGGGKEDLSVVGFEPGTSRFAAGSHKVLERVAHALAERPALQMTVTGAADPVSEREAIQAAALEQRLQAEQRRDLARAGRALEAGAKLPHLSAAERERLLRRLWAESSWGGTGAPASAPGAAPAQAPAKAPPAGPSLADIEAQLARSVVVSTDTARELAIQRGLAVREALVGRGLSTERLFLAAPRLRVSGEDDAAWAPRVELSLSAR